MNSSFLLNLKERGSETEYQQIKNWHNRSDFDFILRDKTLLSSKSETGIFRHLKFDLDLNMENEL